MMIVLSRFAKSFLLVALLTVLLLAACGGDEEPTPEPTVAAPAPTETTAPTATPAAPESPLDQPQSPLSTPISGTETVSETAQVSPSFAAAAAPDLPASKPGTGIIAGRLVSQTTGVPLNHEVVRLAEVVCPDGVMPVNKREECTWALSNAFSPSTFTDPNGYFAFNDVAPNDYIVIIGDMIRKNTKLRDDNGPFMWTATADEVVDIGEHLIEW